MLPTLRTNAIPAPVVGMPVNRLSTLFDGIFGDDGNFPDRATGAMPIAMWEDEDHLFVEAEIPGMTDADIDVTVHNDTLTIRGERRPEEGRRFLYNGRSYGRFERAITLPEAVNVDDVQATLMNGILGITLPKRPETKPRKITLRAS